MRNEQQTWRRDIHLLRRDAGRAGVDDGRGRPQAISKPPPRWDPRQLLVVSCPGEAQASALLCTWRLTISLARDAYGDDCCEWPGAGYRGPQLAGLIP